MMFNVADGGISEPIDWDISNLKPNNSIIVMDEENLRVWLWHGKARLLVPKRTALRQAQSLKGHGWQAGNAIVGRGIGDIVEIDDRKVGHDPETTKWNEKFLEIIKRPYKHIGDHVFVIADGTESSVPLPPPKPVEVKKPIEEKKKLPEVKPLEPARPVAEVKTITSKETGQSHIEIAVACPPTETGEYKELEKKLKAVEDELAKTKADLEKVTGDLSATESKLKESSEKIENLNKNLAASEEKLKEAEEKAKAVPSPSEPAPVTAASVEEKAKDPELIEDIKKAVAIYSIMDQYKDIWASKKSDGSIAMEQLDGKICSFKLEQGKIEFLEGSFSGVSDEIKQNVQQKLDKLLSQL
jgi:hypothetical protein